MHIDFDFKNQILLKSNKKIAFFINVIMKKNKVMLQRCDFFIFEIHRSMLKGDKSLIIDLKRIKSKDSSLEALGGKDVFQKESLEPESFQRCS